MRRSLELEEFPYRERCFEADRAGAL